MGFCIICCIWLFIPPGIPGIPGIPPIPGIIIIDVDDDDDVDIPILLLLLFVIVENECCDGMVMGAVEKEEEGAETDNGNVFPGSDNEGKGVMEDVNV